MYARFDALEHVLGVQVEAEHGELRLGIILHKDDIVVADEHPERTILAIRLLDHDVVEHGQCLHLVDVQVMLERVGDDQVVAIDGALVRLAARHLDLAHQIVRAYLHFEHTAELAIAHERVLGTQRHADGLAQLLGRRLVAEEQLVRLGHHDHVVGLATHERHAARAQPLVALEQLFGQVGEAERHVVGVDRQAAHVRQARELELALELEAVGARHRVDDQRVLVVHAEQVVAVRGQVQRHLVDRDLLVGQLVRALRPHLEVVHVAVVVVCVGRSGLGGDADVELVELEVMRGRYARRGQR